MSFAQFRKFLAGSLLFVLFNVALIGVYLLALQLRGNFHVVVPGELYRSAQISTPDIVRYKQKYGIKTIINLRGENKGHSWYDKEVRTAREQDIRHIDFRFASKKELTQDQAFQLIQIMRDAPKPLLVHCRAGADRTGLAVALYVADVKHWAEFPAELQMSLLYGHIALWFSPAYAMNRTFEMLEPALGYFES